MRLRHFIPVVTFAALPLGLAAQTTPLRSGINTADLDMTAKPGNDFYKFACGGWMTAHPLPAAYSRFGSFDKLAQDNDKRINGILSELASKSYTVGTVEQKLSDFYKLAMDSTRRNKEGLTPLKGLMAETDHAKSIKDILAIQKRHAFSCYGIPVSFGFAADERNASQNILTVSQSGLTLGEREYYLDDDQATVQIRDAYKKFIVNMFTSLGYKGDAEKKMTSIMKIETALAKASKSKTELRDVEANYNKMTMADFESKYPHLHLRDMLLAQGVKDQYMATLVVGQPDFMLGAEKVFAKISAQELRDYVQWNIITDAADYLDDKTADMSFAFFGKVMRGRKEDYPRWKKATSQVESKMGEALGRIYVAKYFPAAAKARMERLVSNLQKALAERIKAQTWMDAATQKAALEKLSTFYVKIGYPNKWTDLSTLHIDPTKSYYENMVACRDFWAKKDIADKAGKLVDKDEWYMYPQTVNAYYNPTTNEICFPAGILQPPFFDMTADDAFNYGAIGVVIGHEMTHGFDDQGRHYDKDGNMTDWWTKQDAENFSKRADGYAAFFSSIKVLPDLNANGRLTLGENLADHGGLQVAYAALKKAEETEPLDKKDGFTPDQRFFLSYAGVWAGNITEKEIRSRTKSDPHSLGQWRVNGALPHIDAWYEAFGITSSDSMYIPKSQRLDLW